jgi:uncharacterized protein DUF4399
MKKRLTALVACGFLALAACGTGEEPAVQEPSPDTGASEAAAVSITQPAADASVAAGDVEVAVAAENFEIVNKLGQPPVAGEGHIHYYFDVDEIPTTPGKPAVTDDESTYHAAATTTYSWPDVPEGEHTFGVQLVNNNHTPLEPPVTAEVTVMVGGELPAG